MITLAAATPARANTIGLNQIITPDIQPLGQLSLSYEAIGSNFGGSDEILANVGVTDRLELADFHQLAPSTDYFAAEYAILQKSPYLLSGGFTNWSTQGDEPRPFLEAGYYKGLYQFTLGAARVGATNAGIDQVNHKSYGTQGIFGIAYTATPTLLLQADYQTGTGNSATAGFTYSVTPSVCVTPSVFISNDPGHAATGYCVLTYTFTAFSPRAAKSADK